MNNFFLLNQKKIYNVYINRHRKLTQNQEKILNSYGSLITIPYQEQVINFHHFFKNQKPLVLEIGFGMGHSLISQAINHPYINFIGIEVYLPGIASCSNLAITLKVNNLRIIYYNAIQVMNLMIPDESLYKIQIFFPDPWPKTRHHKRRLVNIDFAQLIFRKLKFLGYLHIATDSCSYAKHIISIMKSLHTSFNPIFYDPNISSILRRPSTKFEQKAKKLGYIIHDLIYQKLNLNLI
ncbi:MAG: tRNA (guanosine(46)-N7)-methyltransferase TrmB [Candidatus Dasytiphilus stammeri]